MATNKNQHFVPRCYLNAFASDDGCAATNLYNIDRRRFIKQVSLRHQCSRNYFYGTDPLLEDAIQASERSYSRCLSQILKPTFNLTDAHRQLLLRFWLLQHIRTEAASLRSVEMIDGMIRAADLPSQQYRLVVKEAVGIAMRTYVDLIDAIDDLKIVLARNRTEIPFVTSDDPAVLTNRWHIGNPRTAARSFGISSAGALAILPLTPTVVCLGYDGDVYSIQHNGGWINTCRSRDVEAINELQFLNARANVFVAGSDCGQLVHDAFARVADARPSNSQQVHYAPLAAKHAGRAEYRVAEKATALPHSEALIHSQAIRPYPLHWPSFLEWRAGGVVYASRTGAGCVRKCRAQKLDGTLFRKERL